jgi:hypothetical protein
MLPNLYSLLNFATSNDSIPDMMDLTTQGTVDLPRRVSQHPEVALHHFLTAEHTLAGVHFAGGTELF